MTKFVYPTSLPDHRCLSIRLRRRCFVSLVYQVFIHLSTFSKSLKFIRTSSLANSLIRFFKILVRAGGLEPPST